MNSPAHVDASRRLKPWIQRAVCVLCVSAPWVSVPWILLASLGLGAQTGQAPVVTGRLAAATKTVLNAIHVLREKRKTTLDRLEAARRGCRDAERSGNDGWARRWHATAPARTEVYAALERISRPWHDALTACLAAGETAGSPPPVRRLVARYALRVATSYVGLAEPAGLAARIATDRPALATALAWVDDSQARHAFLARVADRHAATPGTSDLDTLLGTLAWEGLLLDRHSPGRTRLRALTADLMLVFTERAPDGFFRSGSRLYRPGRCGDRGFRAALRDGSDQVRHLVWALRLFAACRDRDRAARILQYKEERDARRRGLPLDSADLALNRIAGELVDRYLDADPPLAAGAWIALIRKRVGG